MGPRDGTAAVVSARQTLRRVLGVARAVDRRFQLRPEALSAVASFAAAATAWSIVAALLAGGCGPRTTAHPTHAPKGASPEGGAATDDAPSTAMEKPKPAGPGRAVRMTLYYLAEQSCPDAPQVSLPACGGGSIASVSSSFQKALTMQGSAKLCDGRVVGIQKLKPLCFVVVPPKFPWGLTASGRGATPFRSIAIDRKVFAMGHWYYVPELDGLPLPAPAEGKTHDGCVRADDVGSAVRGDLVDLFVGKRSAVDALKGKLSEAVVHLVPADERCADALAY